jgi:uncharacterized protein YbjQ (UPF0145 family)
MIQKQFNTLVMWYEVLGIRFNLKEIKSFTKINRLFNFCLLISFFCLLFTGCKSNKNLQTTSYYQPNYQNGTYDKKDGLGFQMPDKYPIEILIGEEQPQTATEVIEKLSISDETPIQEGQLYKGRMLNRGNDQQQKKALLDRMVAQAQDLGASGLMKVNYKVFSTAKTTGYTLSGTAFKYVLK